MTERLKKIESRLGGNLLDLTEFERYTGLIDGYTIDVDQRSYEKVLTFYRRRPDGTKVEIPREDLDRAVMNHKRFVNDDLVLTKAVNRLGLDKNLLLEDLTDEQKRVGQMTKKQWVGSKYFRQRQKEIETKTQAKKETAKAVLRSTKCEKSNSRSTIGRSGSESATTTPL
jgi:hypothetical protein